MKNFTQFCFAVVCFLPLTLSGQAIFVVNSANDNDDGVCNSTHCSLREAINASNVNLGPDSIEFNIPGPGPHVIMVNSVLPGILDSFLVIDGTSQPGNNPMASQIILDGSALLPGASHGLVVYTRKTELYGLHLRRFPGDGIQLFGGFIDDPFLSNIIIGAPGKGNVIVSCGSYGIEGPVDRNVRIQGNYIGTDLMFSPGLGNDWDGIFLNVLSGANVRVGGPAPGQQNYLCSNRFSGFRMLIDNAAQFLPGFTITGNVVGTDPSGTRNLGNLGFNFGVIRRGGGIAVLGDGPVTIGGTGALGNVIAFNYDGFYTEGFDRKTVLENSFYCNTDKGIRLEFGANNGIMPPALLCLQGNFLIGNAPTGQLVYLYRHDTTGCGGVPCQGKIYLDRVTADATGTWSYDVSAWPGARFTAITEDSNGNSSEFAECILDPNVSAMNTGPYCPGDTIFLLAALDTAVGNVTYEWLGPGGYTSNQQNPVDATLPGRYFAVANIMGCGADTAFTDVMVYALATDTIRDICIGDSVVVNGVTYHEFMTDGVEILPGAGQFGCDSVVVIDLQYRNAVRARIFSTRPTACPGDTVTFWFDLQLAGGTHDVIYTTGMGQPDTVFGIFDGHREDVIVGTADVFFDIIDVISAQTQCPPLIQLSDSILVSDLEITPMVTNYGGYGVSCFGENDGMISLNVSGATGIVGYQWNLSSLVGDMISQLSAGAYAVTVTDAAGCQIIFDTLVTQPPRFESSIFIDPTTCTGVNDGVLIIDAILGGRGPVEYALNGGAFSPVDSLPFDITGLPAGPVQLELRDTSFCGQNLNLVVPLGETPFIDLGGDRSIFSGDSVLLDFESTLVPIDISWSPLSVVSCATCPVTYAFPPIDQNITLTLIDDQGCVAMDSITIFVFVPKQVYISTVFSPNGDNINDRFYIQASAFAVEVEYLLIVDRWGDVVFEEKNFPVNDPAFGWDGSLNGKMMFPAVYTYLMRIRFTDGEVLPFSGTVTLLR